MTDTIEPDQARAKIDAMCVAFERQHRNGCDGRILGRLFDELAERIHNETGRTVALSVCGGMVIAQILEEPAVPRAPVRAEIRDVK